MQQNLHCTLLWFFLACSNTFPGRRPCVQISFHTCVAAWIGSGCERLYAKHPHCLISARKSTSGDVASVTDHRRISLPRDRWLSWLPWASCLPSCEAFVFLSIFWKLVQRFRPFRQGIGRRHLTASAADEYRYSIGCTLNTLRLGQKNTLGIRSTVNIYRARQNDSFKFVCFPDWATWVWTVQYPKYC